MSIDLFADKTQDLSLVNPGDVITYTMIFSNLVSSTLPLATAFFVDKIPENTTFVLDSVTIDGTPTPGDPSVGFGIPLGPVSIAQGFLIKFKVMVNATAPGNAQISNFATFNYTAYDGAQAISGAIHSNVVTATVIPRQPQPVITKSASKSNIIVGQINTYTITIDNSLSTLPMTNVYLSDALQSGTSYVAGSTVIGTNAPVNADPSVGQGIAIGTIAAGAKLTVSFQVKVDSLPNPNPLLNQAVVTTIINAQPETLASNTIEVRVVTAREQAVTDIIESVALEQAALSHILNAEGEKLQKISQLSVSGDQLLAVNKSVSSMVNSVSRLEMVLQSKLEIFNNCLCK